eukprot:sb/3474965/
MMIVISGVRKLEVELRLVLLLQVDRVLGVPIVLSGVLSLPPLLPPPLSDSKSRKLCCLTGLYFSGVGRVSSQTSRILAGRLDGWREELLHPELPGEIFRPLTERDCRDVVEEVGGVERCQCRRVGDGAAAC